MSDVHTEAIRRLNMSRIRARDTKPEMTVRRGLHARGLRYRLHDNRLPGKPDLVFRGRRVVVFVHGCFWHLHGCALSKLPEARRDFWSTKLTSNASRDRKVMQTLQARGWRVLVVWECATRGTGRLDEEDLLNTAARFIKSGQRTYCEIRGQATDG